jgi:hypothetical protein
VPARASGGFEVFPRNSRQQAASPIAIKNAGQSVIYVTGSLFNIKVGTTQVGFSLRGYE